MSFSATFTEKKMDHMLSIHQLNTSVSQHSSVYIQENRYYFFQTQVTILDGTSGSRDRYKIGSVSLSTTCIRVRDHC